MLRAVQPPSRSRALALLAWLLCALLGPGPALPALHFALVAHRVCPEHGQLEHVEASARGLERESATSSAHAARDAGAALIAGRAGAAPHEHEPCGVGAAGSHVAVLPAERAARVSASACAPSAPSGTERAHPCVALLSYAPKLAPPPRG